MQSGKSFHPLNRSQSVCHVVISACFISRKERMILHKTIVYMLTFDDAVKFGEQLTNSTVTQLEFSIIKSPVICDAG